MVDELYEALRKAGVEEQLARDAARAVLARDTVTDLATKADLAELKAATKADLAVLRSEFRQEMAELKADLIKWNVGAMAVLTAIFAAIVRLA
jgi:hypothetical protein